MYKRQILADLRANFEGECSEVGMYLAMARVAHREGYPEIGLYWEKAAYEEAEHAAKFAELLGEVVTDSTKKLSLIHISGMVTPRYRSSNKRIFFQLCPAICQVSFANVFIYAFMSVPSARLLPALPVPE